MAYKWSPKQCEKEAVIPNKVVYMISCQGLCTHNEWPYLEFQLTATHFMSMAAKSSDIVDKRSGANLQVDGHVEMPTQGAKDQWEPEGEDSSPTHLPSLSPAQRLLSGCPNMKYCLEKRVMLTEELGAIPPPSHSWTAPLVEDILCDARTWLTEAVVIGPGRVVLFYSRHSMGEGLRADEASDAAFLLTGAGRWVGKSAYLTANPMTIHEGRRAIAQVISDNRVKVRWPGCPRVHPLAHQPFHFTPWRNSPAKDTLRDDGFDYPPSPCRPSRGCKCNRWWRDCRSQLPRFAIAFSSPWLREW